VTSIFSPGSTSDFRPLVPGVDPLVESLATCPQCKFTAAHSRFAKPEGLDAAKVRRALSGLDSPRLSRTLDAAMAVERSWTDDPQTLAHLALAAKWEADDTGEPQRIRARTLMAIAAQERAWNAPRPEPLPDRKEAESGDPVEAGDEDPDVVEEPGEDVEPDNRAVNAYLAGELHRQTGQREQAIAWLERALASNRDPEFEPRIRRQLFLTRHAGKPDAQVLALARDGSAPERLAAVELLAVSSEVGVLPFLEEVCLGGEPSNREEAMRTLLRAEEGPHCGSPRVFHAPIFLGALEGDDVRGVQLGAAAVEELRLREAMPRLLRKIETCTSSEEYRLFAALAPLATAEDALALKRLLESRRCAKGSRLRPLLLKALLETRSVEAVPAILELAADAPSLPDDQDLEIKAATFGPALVAALPDLESAGSSAALAALKVRILGRLESPESLASLVTSYERGGALALEAALALLRRGDPRGKARILEDIEALRERWRGELALLPPFLEPADFVTIRDQMEACREKAWKELEEMRDRAAREPDAEFVDDVNWDYELENYLPLLGATRNPAARPILLHYLDRSDSVQLQKAAIDGLSFMNDAEVALRLRGLLATSDFYLVDAIAASAARTRDASLADALVALMNEPTPVETKAAWTMALEVLAPDRATPFWEAWSRSPHPRLRSIASAALARVSQRDSSPGDSAPPR
jgi:hypothetical protein